MITGEPLFQGEDVAETLAAVIYQQPDLERVPARARKLLRRCLEKDPRQRLRDIGDAKDLLETGPQAAPTARSIPALTTGLIGLLIVALAALGFVHFREQPEQRPVLQYTVTPPEKAKEVSYFAVSPDGRYLAMVASGDGPRQIWVRSLDSLQTQALAGTEGATFPFWSPDSRYIAFFGAQGTQSKLKKISVTGGPPQTLCDAPDSRGGAWGRRGVIVFAPLNGTEGLSRVAETGGVPVNITEIKSGTHRWPMFLPDGNRFLFLAAGGAASGIYLASLDDPKRARRLVPDEGNPQYLAPQPGSELGHLLFVRAGALIAQPVNARTMDKRGEPFPVAEQISRAPLVGFSLYSISRTGMLVYWTGGGISASKQLVWLDRTGKELEKAGGPVRIRDNFAMSQDGKRVVVGRIAEESSGNTDLWITDLEDSGRETRLTFDASQNSFPVWSPDGNRVAFVSNRNGGTPNLYQRASNGTGQDQLLFESNADQKLPWDWSRDGGFIIFSVLDLKTGYDIWALPVTAPGEKKPFVVRNSPYQETQGQLSPDGRWLAYTSNESGTNQVYVAPFAPAFDKPITGKWQISVAGGTQPRWRGDGKEFYYVGPDRKLMAVEVKARVESFDRGTPQPLFELRSSSDANNWGVWGYVPSADGKRFLVAEPSVANADAPPPPLTVVVNWLGSVKK